MKTQANTTINDTDQLTDVLQAIYRRHHNKAEFSRAKRLWVESAVRNGAPEKQAWDAANQCQHRARNAVEYDQLMNQLGAGEVIATKPEQLTYADMVEELGEALF